MSKYVYIPGVEVREGNVIPTLKLVEDRNGHSLYSCLGHKFEGDELLELVNAANVAIKSAEKLK